MKKYTLLLFGMLLTQAAISQFTLTYNENGLLTRLEENKGISLNVILPDDEEKKKEAKQLLYDKCKKAAEALDPASSLYPFYLAIWPADVLVQMRRELTAIASGTTGGLQHFPDLSTGLLSFNRDQVYTKTTSATGVTIQFNNLVNKLLVQYYQTLINAPANKSIKTLNLQTYMQIADYLSQTVLSLNQTITEARTHTTETNRQALLASGTFKSHPLYIAGISLLSTPWCKGWLWYTEGEIRLHPFEFASTAYLQKYPQFDRQKSILFNEYVDSLIHRHIRYDTSEKIAAFKTLLSEQESGAQEFSYKDRLDKIKADNEAAVKQITQVSRILNKTTFPANNATIQPHLYYFADSKIKGIYDYEPGETGAIPNTETKQVVVHNVSAGTKILVRESPTPIEDYSTFRTFTNDFSTQLTSLVPGLITASGIITPILNSLQSQTNPVVSLSNGVTKGPDKTKSHKNFDGFSEVIAHLKKLEIYNEEIFEGMIQHVKGFGNLISNLLDVDEHFDTAIQVYQIFYNHQYDLALTKAATDSLILFHVNTAISNSAIPDPAFKATSEKEPLYASELKATSVQDQAVRNEVKIVAQKGTDSSTIATFTYKAGKRHRYQLSAGLAYSYPDPVENTLVQNGDLLSIDQKKEPIQLVAGINIYLGKGLFLQDNSVRLYDWSRWSLFAGVGINSPIKNIYTAISWDIVPSVRLSIGSHFHDITKYELKNNQVASKRTQYQPYLFSGITIDPVSLISTLNIFK